MSNTTQKVKPAKSPKKTGRFNSTAELLQHTFDDKQFVEDSLTQIQSRSIIDFLMAQRALKGMNQSDIAAAMGCSQSRISKLENGTDDELTVGEFHAYCQAIGLSFSISLMRQNAKIADQVKHHILRARKLLRKLAELSKDDDAMISGLRGFCVEVLFNSALSVVEVEKRLTKLVGKANVLAEIPTIQFEEDSSLTSQEA